MSESLTNNNINNTDENENDDVENNGTSSATATPGIDDDDVVISPTTTRTSPIMLHPDDILHLTAGECSDEMMQQQKTMQKMIPPPIAENKDKDKTMMTTIQELDLEQGRGGTATTTETGTGSTENDENNVVAKPSPSSNKEETAITSSSSSQHQQQQVALLDSSVIRSTSSKPHRVGSHRVAGHRPTRRTNSVAENDDDEQEEELDDRDPSTMTLTSTTSEDDEDIHKDADDDNNNVQGGGEVHAVIVSRDDIEQEVRNQIYQETVEAEVICTQDNNNNDKEASSSPPANHHHRSNNKYYWGLLFLLLLSILVVAIVIGISREGDNDDDDNSNSIGSTTSDSNSSATVTPFDDNNNDGFISSTTLTPSSSSQLIDDDDGYDFVYVIAMSIVNFCGHEVHRVGDCGGHLATITSPEEKEIIDHLAGLAMEDIQRNNYTNRGGPIPGIWLGGEQFHHSRNNTGPDDDDSSSNWRWVDDSTWFDDDGKYWAPGQPDNFLDTLNNKTEGQHHLMLNGTSMEYIDRNGCLGSIAPKAPGIYILPKDYYDADKYPNCRTSTFLREHDTPVPPRPEPEQVYVTNVWTGNWCAHTEFATECGGHMASITSSREKAIVDDLKDNAIAEAIEAITNQDFGEINFYADAVWIGGQQLQGMNDTGSDEEDVVWGWVDGSVWFDNNGEYWADGQPNNTIHSHRHDDSIIEGEHAVMLREDGKFIDDLKACWSGHRAPGILILPSDYKDRTKYPDCRTGYHTEVVPVPPRS